MQRLYETGLYSQVQMSAARSESLANRIDLGVRLAERRARWVDLGVGSGTAGLFRMTAAWGHRNLAPGPALGTDSGRPG